MKKTISLLLAGIFLCSQSFAAFIPAATKAEDSASASADQITPIGVIQQASPADAASEGDYAVPQMSGGRLWVDASGKTLTVGSHAVTNAGTFVVQENGAALTALQLIDDPVFADDAGFTPATSKVHMAGFEFDDVAPDSVDEGDAGAARMSARREVYVQLRDAAGNERGLNIDASNRLAATVTAASGAFASGSIASGALASGSIASGAIASGAVASGAIASGAFASGSIASGAIAAGAIAAGATSIADDEDVASANADRLVKIAAIRDDTLDARSATEGDYEQFHLNANGALWTIDVNSAANLTSTQLIDDTIVADDAGFTAATTKVNVAGFVADESSTDSVNEDDAGAARMTLDRKQIATLYPHTAGGLSTFMASGSDGSSILVATAQAIKASAGQLYGYYAYNPEAAVTFVHFYNTAAASVTVGTTNPLFTIAIPAGSAANLTFPYGVTFSNAGWSCAATTTAGGNTAPATGVSLVAWYA